MDVVDLVKPNCDERKRMRHRSRFLCTSLIPLPDTRNELPLSPDAE